VPKFDATERSCMFPTGCDNSKATHCGATAMAVLHSCRLGKMTGRCVASLVPRASGAAGVVARTVFYDTQASLHIRSTMVLVQFHLPPWRLFPTTIPHTMPIQFIHTPSLCDRTSIVIVDTGPFNESEKIASR
jgi:hypothetical protein